MFWASSSYLRGLSLAFSVTSLESCLISLSHLSWPDSLLSFWQIKANWTWLELSRLYFCRRYTVVMVSEVLPKLSHVCCSLVASYGVLLVCGFLLVSEVQTCTSCFWVGHVFIVVSLLCHMHSMTTLKLKIVNFENFNTVSFLSFFRKAQEGRKKVVLAGCVPQAQPRQDYLKGLSIIGVCIFIN